MNEESQTPSTEQASSTDEAQTLDDVYKQYNVEEQATSFAPQRSTNQEQQQQPKQSVTPAIPDPVLDPNGYKQWQGQQQDLVQQALSSLVGEVTTLKNERKQQREEADIKGAVQSFRKIVGDSVDEDMAEVALGY